jgi:hypothetical protein
MILYNDRIFGIVQNRSTVLKSKNYILQFNSNLFEQPSLTKWTNKLFMPFSS